MAKRTCVAAVRELGGFDESITIDGFIDTASKLVDRVETAGVSDQALLELIERWLAAHMVSLTADPTVAMKQIDITKTQYYPRSFGASLDSTPYGRQALALDTTYTLEDAYGTQAHSLWLGDPTPDD